MIAFAVATPVEADAARKKARTTQTSSKKSNSKKKGTKATSKKKSNGGAKKRKASAVRKAAAPKEVASNDSLTLLVNSLLTADINPALDPGGLRVNLAKPDASSKKLTVQLNERFTYLPVNRELISGFEKSLKKELPDSVSDYSISFNVGSKPYSAYISTIDKLPEQYRKNKPFVIPASPYVHAVKGMQGDIVALWHSHGRYYKQGGWYWQRPFLFQTAEDIYTMSYVLPFITPMLENAGAYVMLPRERDINTNEVIVDNDLNPYGEIFSQTTYKEMSGAKKWETGSQEGFIYDIPDFRDTENPFTNGTYRQAETIKSGKYSAAGWYADIPEDGEYAVYVSYKTLPNSTEDARYTVNYSGGSREFIVNQTMGGGTWIYLGTFPLRAGYDDKTPVVSLSNKSEKSAGKVVTADAVKIGGGMGNIARSPRRSDVSWGTDVAVADSSAPSQAMEDEISDSSEDDGDDEEDDEDDEEDDEGDDEEDGPVKGVDAVPATNQGQPPRFTTSGLPRFLEGARYWLHWAGFPESVYSNYNGTDDYKDDFTSRGRWVNYLAGGSRVLPNRSGLRIPIDVSFALHTDAGKRDGDSFIGTLGIYYTDGGRSYTDGTPRNNSRILTDMIMRQVVGDIRRTYEPRWTRRSMWDKSYAEARTAEVPSTLLELLSHQNFADMQYGLDPTFRFTVSRSIYKAIGRFIAERKGREFIVQPLPVDAFSITREKKGVYRLRWQKVDDPLEPTAKPSKYIVMERTEGNLGFKKIGETSATTFEVKVTDSKIHSFYIIAANEGGLSFPSETLSLRDGNDRPVLIVNGFTRVSGPKSFVNGGRAGFLAEEDFGVPYLRDISFSGYQQEFSRGAGDGFGRSGSNYVSTVVGGNTFDYPAVHGKAIAKAGRSFVSASLKAVEIGAVKLTDYPLVDLILGKQKQVKVGNGNREPRYEAFPAELQKKLREYINKGGDLIVSGQNIVSELYSDHAGSEGREFAESVLGLSDTSEATRGKGGKVKVSGLGRNLSGESITYCNTLRKDHYIVEQADVLEAVPGVQAEQILSFGDGSAAGLAIKRGKSDIMVMTIPFESITEADKAARLMKELIDRSND
ncbi:MAG: xanthan lyase [Muribaculaceae bacterium]|nr:xanthan lyase [Muribaculaceae bacterium]